VSTQGTDDARTALSEAQVQKQARAGEFNRDALQDWEIMQPGFSAVDSPDKRLSLQAKKRMREILALSMAGAVQQQNNPIRIELRGDNHDLLVFSHSKLDASVADSVIRTFDNEPTTNFWNAMRLMDFKEVLFIGDNFKRSVSRVEFITKGKNFEKYKADYMKAMGQVQAAAQGEASKPEHLGQATWIDPVTSLMWTRQDNGQDVNWNQASDYCRNLNFASHRDWRLPKIDELAALYDKNQDVNRRHIRGGIRLAGWFGWSSSAGNRSGEAWGVDFLSGGRYSDPIGDSQNGLALCVRGPEKNHSGIQ
jgi:hypothetical protein